MKNKLKKTTVTIWHFVDGVKVDGAPSTVWGDVSDVSGDLSDVRGDLSGVRGDLSGVRGDLSGVRGYLSGVRGDLDICEITDEDRVKGINISDLIGE